MGVSLFPATPPCSQDLHGLPKGQGGETHAHCGLAACGVLYAGMPPDFPTTPMK